MFYKENYTSKEEMVKFDGDFAPEFVYALYEKVKAITTRYVLGIIYDKVEHKVIKPVIARTSKIDVKYNGNIKEACLDINGLWQFNAGYCNLSQFKKEFESDYSKMSEAKKRDKFEFHELSEEEFKKIFHLHEKELKEAKELVTDFHNIKKEEIIKDKDGNSYRLLIVENSDPTIRSDLIVDEAILFNDDNEEIGYLLTKYTTKDIQEKLLLKLKEKYKPEADIFMDVAGVDYSKLSENYRNKGLGKAMYFAMASHLNYKDLHFRASELQSVEAKRLWNGLLKDYPNNIKLNQYKGKEYYFFNSEGFAKGLNEKSNQDLKAKSKKVKYSHI